MMCALRLPRGVRHFVFATIASCTPLVLAQAQAHGQTPAVSDANHTAYDLSAQGLNESLQIFAQKSGVDLFYTPDVVRTYRSNALKGVFTPQIALQKLLSGTGLRAHFTGPKAAIILSENAPPPAAPSAQTPASMAVMMLDRAEVRSTPILSFPNPAAVRAYARRIQDRIQAELSNDPASRTTPYQIQLSVKIDPDACLSDVRLIKGSGDARQDQHILARISGLCTQEAPPPWRQAFRFEIQSQPVAAYADGGRR